MASPADHPGSARSRGVGFTGRHIRVALAILAGLAGAAAVADEQRPLQSFPYTPGLDPAAMDRRADPCEDFFRYSCGGWIENNPIPPDKAAWSVYGKLAEDNLKYLWGLLESAADPAVPHDATQQRLGDYFAACMDTATIDARGIAPLMPVFDEISALKGRDDLAPLLARLHGGMGNGEMLFGYTAEQDLDDSSKYIGMFFSGGLGLPERDYYLSGDARMRETRARYREHIARMLELTGETPRRARRSAKQALAFEKRLAAATLSVEDRQDPTRINHPMPVASLQNEAPGFDWLEYVRLRSPETLDRVNVTEPAFVRRVGRLVSRAPLGELKNYLRWSYLRSQASILAKPIADESFAFNSTYLNGVKEQPPRWRTCVADADEDLGEALGQLFVARTFSEQTREQAVHMIGIVQEVMRQRISQLDWMSEMTRQRALGKLAAMRNKVGYPGKWRDYGALAIDREDYFGNRWRASAFEESRLLARIGKPVDPDEWAMTPQTVNAYYDPARNEMNFPAGVLQPPLFDPTIDAAPSWGNTGGTVGHELTHAFDDAGRHFDAQGNLKDWWTPEDAAEFEKRTQCLVDQYGKYIVVDDIRLNSKLTLGEDLADLAGTLLAYAGWKSATAGQALQPRDGLTPDQRFFVGYAQWACGGQTDQRARVVARTSPHSPLRFRVNGVMPNIPEFAQAFHCRPADAMYKKPEDVCRIW